LRQLISALVAAPLTEVGDFDQLSRTLALTVRMQCRPLRTVDQRIQQDPTEPRGGRDYAEFMKPLRTTPAVALGITDRVWSIDTEEEIVDSSPVSFSAGEKSWNAAVITAVIVKEKGAPNGESLASKADRLPTVVALQRPPAATVEEAGGASAARAPEPEIMAAAPVEAFDPKVELPLKVVQARLGHASIQMTADRYGPGVYCRRAVPYVVWR
jgi:hypothetical protein